MGVDTKKNTSADAGKEQHNGAGTAARQIERSRHPHKPGAGSVFKSHVGANDTNDNCNTDLIPELGNYGGQ